MFYFPIPSRKDERTYNQIKQEEQTEGGAHGTEASIRQTVSVLGVLPSYQLICKFSPSLYAQEEVTASKTALSPPLLFSFPTDNTTDRRMQSNVVTTFKLAPAADCPRAGQQQCLLPSRSAADRSSRQKLPILISRPLAAERQFLQ